MNSVGYTGSLFSSRLTYLLHVAHICQGCKVMMSLQGLLSSCRVMSFACCASPVVLRQLCFFPAHCWCEQLDLELIYIKFLDAQYHTYPWVAV